MRTDEVPQDNSSTYAGHKKLLYARDQDGTYTQVPSTGWEVEAAATKDAVALYQQLADQALEQVRAGEKSPLFYHMYQCRMDPALLAQVTGLFRWRVKWHFRPKPFRRLSQSLLQRYAEALDISVDQLTQTPDTQ
ncbi:hypothetical protein [Marinimicrobium sp. ABcell2]|uniref:hypothetical protein n=1 Tax=Marinimicrobium sp. ABcell2 TaxID=3069751 RepID=UPI0027AF424B|nr:hypothetical protein [Marinimicrobium sp. ABcell2]MDQ2076987.1 hypothetical protein [Marinimicrobium sp. ABcell2]